MQRYEYQIYLEFAYKNSAKDGSIAGKADLEALWVVYEPGASMIVNLERMAKGKGWYATIFKNYRSAAKKDRLICISLL